MARTGKGKGKANAPRARGNGKTTNNKGNRDDDEVKHDIFDIIMRDGDGDDNILNGNGDISDEEIEEDGAFDDADEALYGDILHTINKRKAGKQQGRGAIDTSDASDVSDGEDDGSDAGDDGQGSEDDLMAGDEEGLAPLKGGILLSDLFDNNNSNNNNSNSNNSNIVTAALSTRQYDSDEDDRNEFGDSDSDGDDDDDDDDEDDEDEDDEEARRENMIKVAERASKKNTPKEAKRANARAEARAAERTEPGAEGEFSAHRSSGLQLGTLVNSLSDSKALSDIKRRAEMMEKAEVVTAPVARIHEERADRQVGYEETKKTVSLWQETVKTMRKQPTLTFPLEQSGRIKTTTNSLTASFETKTDLETAIQNALESSGLAGDAAVKKSEIDELEARFDPEEIKAKQKAAAMLRAQMSYQERKFARQKKNKSKEARKRLKRKLNREAEKEEAMLRELDPEAAKMLDEQAALARAQERMSLRHKNTSRFMRNMAKARGFNNEDTREIVMENIERERQLMRRMEAIGDGDDDSSDDSSDENGDDSDSGAGQAHGASKEEGEEEEQKGLFALQFMKNGMKRRQEEATQHQRLMDKAHGLIADSDDDSDASNDGAAPTGGRRTFQPSGGSAVVSNSKALGATGGATKSAKRSKTSGSLALGTSAGAVVKMPESAPLFEVPSFEGVAQAEASFGGRDATGDAKKNADGENNNKNNNMQNSKQQVNKSKNKRKSKAETKGGNGDDGGDGDDDDSNPWLQTDETEAKVSNKKRKKKNGEEAGGPGLDLRKMAAMSTTAKATRGGSKPSKQTNGNKNGEGKTNSSASEVDKGDEKDRDEDQDEDWKVGREQRAVLERAFTNAVAQEDFEEEQRELEQTAADREAAKEATMVGWGSWTGAGVAPKPQKSKAAKTRALIKAGKRAIADASAAAKISNSNNNGSGSSKKAKLKHVVLSERVNKKALKYAMDEVPYPFTSREQYERSLQTPVGNDWNTLSTFKSNIRPEVITKQGTIIEPVKLTRGAIKLATMTQSEKAVATMRLNARKKEQRLKLRRQRKNTGM